MTLGNPDPKFWKRLLLAFVLAVAIHEIVIGAGGFLRFSEPSKRPVPEATTVVLIAPLIRVPSPTPTPAPSPTATPTPPPRATAAPKVAVAAPRATVLAKKHSGGSQGGPKLKVDIPKTVYHSTPVPVVHATESGSKVVADTGTGASPTPGPAQGNGVGTGAGSGAGSAQGAGGGTGGAGSGPSNSVAPCGAPYFTGIRRKYNVADGSVDEIVRVTLHLGNGQSIAGEFGYPWHYSKPEDDPWSPSTKIGLNDPVDAQMPPKNFDVTKEPLAVQLTLRYTDRVTGTTFFRDCPDMGAKSP